MKPTSPATLTLFRANATKTAEAAPLTGLSFANQALLLRLRASR